jgi:hypothetical protein
MLALHYDGNEDPLAEDAPEDVEVAWPTREQSARLLRRDCGWRGRLRRWAARRRG